MSFFFALTEADLLCIYYLDWSIRNILRRIPRSRILSHPPKPVVCPNRCDPSRLVVLQAPSSLYLTSSIRVSKSSDSELHTHRCPRYLLHAPRILITRAYFIGADPWWITSSAILGVHIPPAQVFCLQTGFSSGDTLPQGKRMVSIFMCYSVISVLSEDLSVRLLQSFTGQWVTPLNGSNQIYGLKFEAIILILFALCLGILCLL